MKFTLDTNILVSAFISKYGYPAKLLDLLLTLPNVELVLSNPILDEFREVMMRGEVRRRFHYSAEDVEVFVKTLRSISTTTRIKSKFEVVKEDPKDNMILDTAYDGGAKYIVSGDKHLLQLKRFKNIQIISPRQMMEVITERFSELIVPKEEADNEGEP